ncbi:ACP S-malonyltransferase [Yinghuangia sp. YIM S09857]|uniref:ACP S-malonyltransferase n=1 Tax=Yinghuangia sp. YIM S09857 TaxID=3436929 RepID=UPI003F53B3AB
MLVLVAPGQGAQTPGFLTPWLDLPGVADRLTWWSAVTGLDLIHYGTKADAEAIRDTAVAQPLLVASGLVAALALFPHPSDAYRVVGGAAGHSVGELTAAAGTGVISAESAMVLVRERGKAMAAAAAVTETGMSAVLGGDAEQVVAKIAEHGLTPANMNGAGQIVAAGTLPQLAAFAADPPEKARVRPLAVAGAFHTHHMAPAVDRLAELVPGVTVRDPRTPYISNTDGAVLHDGREIVRRLVSQVSNPVRWDLCMETMRDLGVTAVIEVPPAGTLTGLAKRALPGVETLALKTPDDLEAARVLVEKHGTPSTLHPQGSV